MHTTLPGKILVNLAYLLSLSLISLSTWASPLRWLPDKLMSDTPPWELKLDENDIQIYVRDHPGSEFKAFKAVAELDASLDQVISVMANPKSCLEWVHGCVVSYGFDAKSFNQRYAYSVNDLPWPVDDRDYVIQINTWRDAETGKIFMEMHAVDDKKPEDPQYQRVNVAQTVYIFEALPDNKTRMIWLQHTEPNGALPSWLVNGLLIDIPYKSIRKLEEVAQWEKYRQGKIILDSDGEIVGVQNPGLAP